MTIRQLFTFVITSLSLISLAQANTFYRHIPFTLSVANTDKVIIDYDFTGHRGISCQSGNADFLATFVYKGNQKSANLPVILQNSKIPTKDGEELADVSGQFSLIGTADGKLSCGFVD